MMSRSRRNPQPTQKVVEMASVSGPEPKDSQKALASAARGAGQDVVAAERMRLAG